VGVPPPAAVAWWALGAAGTTNPGPPEVSLQPLTFHGQAGDATISPDGRFIAYVRRDATQSSVVVKQLSSDSDVTILPPRAGASYFAPSVTPDGGHVDVLVGEAGPKISLVRLPFLGGAPRKLADNARSGIAWSPDGRRMAFIRSDAQTQNSLIVADAQGQNAKILVTRHAPSFFLSITFGRRSYRPSWSPDGRRITVVGLDTSPNRLNNATELLEIDAQDGTERPVRLDNGLSVLEAVYLDGDRWVASAVEETNQASQWRIIPRNGPPMKLTRDLSDLVGVQLTATRSAGVATRVMRRSTVSVLDLATGDIRPVIEDSSAGPSAAAVDAAGNVFYTAMAADGFATYRHGRPGGAASVVATDVGGALLSPDGSFLIGSRWNGGLVRANADGSDARVLLEDVTAFPAAITRDNAVLVYQSNRQGHQQPWKLTLATGEAQRLSEMYVDARSLWLSPDEREVILNTTGGARICTFPAFDACRAVKVIAGPLSADGKTAFTVLRTDPANLVAQPLDGGEPTPVTHFTDKVIVDFRLSPDRTRMAFTRGTQIADVVLVTGVK
jgi:hypothetical protein